MKVLVTGGAGYIGSITVTKLINEGFEVNVLDDLSTGHRENIHPKAKFIEGSILDETSLELAIEGCAAVIHLAAKSIVSESIEKPNDYQETNLEGTNSLIKKIKNKPVKKLIFASTASVYEMSHEPIREISKLLPVNPYGQTKLAGENLIQLDLIGTNIDFFIFRFFNVAGNYTNNDFKTLYEDHRPETHLIPSVLKSLNSKEFVVYGQNYDTKDGTCVRDYLHVLDLIDAFIVALQSKNRFKDIFNLGSGVGYSVLEVVKEIELHSNQKVELKYLNRIK
jgi:UDP-glucose 4-epimerase